MKYLEVRIETKSENIEQIEAALLELGITSIQIEDPNEMAEMIDSLGETEWYDKEQVSTEWLHLPEENAEASFDFDDLRNSPAYVTVYLDADSEGERKYRQIEELIDSAVVTMNVRDDAEWKDRWKEYYYPTRISKRIVVAPTWSAEEEIETARKGTYTEPRLYAYGEESPGGRSHAYGEKSYGGNPYAYGEEGHGGNPYSYGEESHGGNPYAYGEGPGSGSNIYVEENPDGSEADIVIRLDPGMAFGTGMHETTALTLRFMEKYLPGEAKNASNVKDSTSENDVVDENDVTDVHGGLRVLDVGTGSGVLAIAAAKLGATQILGIDIDEEAVRVAKENLAANLLESKDDSAPAIAQAGNLSPGRVQEDDSAPVIAQASNLSPGRAQEEDSAPAIAQAGKVLVSSISRKGKDPQSIVIQLGDLTEGVDFVADVVVANLLTDLVIRFAPDAAKHLVRGGLFISSGILAEHYDRVAEAIINAGFDASTMETMYDGEWCSIAARKL